MSLIYNDTIVQNVMYNGSEVKTIIYNGVTVYQKSSSVSDIMVGVEEKRAKSLTINSNNISLISITDDAFIDKTILSNTIKTDYASEYSYDIDYVSTNDSKFALTTEYEYESAEEVIDSGYLSVIAIDSSVFTYIGKVEVEML